MRSARDTGVAGVADAVAPRPPASSRLALPCTVVAGVPWFGAIGGRRPLPAAPPLPAPGSSIRFAGFEDGSESRCTGHASPCGGWRVSSRALARALTCWYMAPIGVVTASLGCAWPPTAAHGRPYMPTPYTWAPSASPVPSPAAPPSTLQASKWILRSQRAAPGAGLAPGEAAAAVAFGAAPVQGEPGGESCVSSGSKDGSLWPLLAARCTATWDSWAAAGWLAPTESWTGGWAAGRSE